jgi:peptide-methionine (S)-S-oxide reductase
MPRHALAFTALAALLACNPAHGESNKHAVFGTPLDYQPPGTEVAMFAMGCFWGAEEYFFKLPGVVSTAVGYSGGTKDQPSYDDVSGGATGHAETVRVVYDPKKVSYERLLQVFWENHVPTQGNRQGNDHGSQYRSAIFTFSDAQQRAAMESRDAYAGALRKAGHKDAITTEIKPAQTFWYAESFHQQYCAKNPQGYCGHGGAGVAYPRK